MALINFKLTAAAAGLAAFSMAAMPAAAAELPLAGPAEFAAYDAEAANAEQYRYRRDRRDRGIDTGDVIAGVAVLGAIAAIASAASNNRDRDYRRDDVRYRDTGVDERSGTYDSRGMERAVDMCVAQVERERERVEDIDSATRDARGWNVGGRTSSGQGFDCWIDNEGRIRSVDLNDGYAASSSDPYQGQEQGASQWSDADYARARAGTRYESSNEYSYDDDSYGQQPAAGDGPRPAYPGGPLPGEEGYDDRPVYQGDDRYGVAAR